MYLVEIPQQIFGIINRRGLETIGPRAFGLTFITALAFAMIHLFSGQIHKFLHKQEHKVTSVEEWLLLMFLCT